MLGVAHSLRYSMALLAGHNLVSHMAFGCIVTIAFSISIRISISSMSTMTIVPTIAWVSICFGFSGGLCLSRTHRKRKEAKKNYKLRRR